MVSKRKIKVLAPIGYPWTFNGPRRSRNYVSREKYLPFNKFISGMDGSTIFNPLSVTRSDLIHCFNRVPFNRKRFIIGFESHMPRTFGYNAEWYTRFMWRRIVSGDCAGIFPISRYAKQIFDRQIDDSGLSTSDAEIIRKKTVVRYPNIELRPFASRPADRPLVITFVGSHFARKGGLVLLKLAEYSQAKKLPVTFNIISQLEWGGDIWTDPTSDKFYSKYEQLLDLPNIRLMGGMSNGDVQEILKLSDLCMLTTFADTFGFSAIEAMSYGTPVLATEHGALPEFISHGRTGFLIRAAKTAGSQEWNPDYSRRGSVEFEREFDDAVLRMTDDSVRVLEEILANRSQLSDIRRGAHETCRDLFSAEEASLFWDDCYEAVVERART